MERELNNILTRNNEGYRGLVKASEYIREKSLKNFLEALAQKKKDQADEIKALMEERNLKPVKSNSVLGNLHQSFMDVVGGLSSKKESAIIKECIRGEKMAREDYEKALKSNVLDEEALKIAMKHRDRSLAAIQTLQKLSSVVV